jgi:hypothetical protein
LLGFPGRRRAVDQDGNDPYAAREPGPDLDAHEIIGVVEATRVVPVCGRGAGFRALHEAAPPPGGANPRP